MKRIILDTNILFSSLLPASREIRDVILLSENFEFYSCNYAIVEMFKHKSKIVESAKIDEYKILEILHKILKAITFIREDSVSEFSLKRAYELCHDVDEKDIPFIALTIELDGLLWTGDRKLKTKLVEKGFDKFFEI
ncbi:PIN domain-containing protein [Candidatus Pyrohabitans sp.]